MLGLSRPIRWLPSCLYPSSFIEITRLQRSRTQLRLCAAFKRTSQLILIDVCPTVSFTTPLKQKGFEREVCLSAHAVVGRDASLSLPRSLPALLLSSSRLLQKHLLLPLEYQGQRLLNVKMRGIIVSMMFFMEHLRSGHTVLMLVHLQKCWNMLHRLYQMIIS